MKPAIKALWVEALRSKQYRKGRGQLRKNGAFCCLGVLCNLHAIAHPEIAAKQKRKDKYMRSEDYLPKAVMEWSGLSDRLPQVPVANVPKRIFKAHFNPIDIELNRDTGLPFLNDETNITFAELADVIDKSL